MYKCFWDSLTPQSGFLASWIAASATVIAAIASVVLLSGLWLTKQSMRQSAQDSALQLKKSEQASVFQRMYEQFNAPTMHYARAVFAKTHLDREKEYGHGKMKDGYIPSHGWQVVNFLNQVGHQVQADRLIFEDVEIAYASHLQYIVGIWKEQLDLECRESRYKPLLDLHDRIMASNLPKDVKSKLDVLDDEFWESEASLNANAKSEG
jgi:hypothetical protein